MRFVTKSQMCSRINVINSVEIICESKFYKFIIHVKNLEKFLITHRPNRYGIKKIIPLEITKFPSPFLPRKEVIHRQLPLPMPCYDFVPVTDFTVVPS